MKKFLIIPIIVCLFSSKSNAQWQLVFSTIYASSLIAKDTGMIAGSGNLIYISDKTGTLWTYANCPANMARTMAVMDSSLFVTANIGGLYKSFDYGNSWMTVDSGIDNPPLAYTITSVDSLLILGSSGDLISDSADIYMSYDHGISWSKVFSRAPGDNFYSIAASGEKIVASVFTRGFCYSPDRGATWSVRNDTILARAVGIAGNNILCRYAGTPSGIYLSNDNGVNWTSVFPVFNVHCFLRYKNITFAGTSSGFQYSVDDGYTWITDNAGLPPATQVLSIGIVDSVIVIGTTNTEIYIRNVTAIAAGLQENNFDKESFSIYPDPSQGIFTVDTKDYFKDAQIRIYNSTGIEVFSGNMQNPRKEINISNAVDGIYFVKVCNGEFAATKKMVLLKN